MELLNFDDIFTDEDISNYKLFIEKLKQLKQKGKTTRDILGIIFQYYKKYVTYNYDQMQIIKINNVHIHPEIEKVFRNNISHPKTTENIEQLKQSFINELNNVFMQIEGRPLTQRTINFLFGEYGMVVHHKAKRYEMFGEERTIDAYDEIKGVNIGKYFQAKYENGMLKEGICGDFAKEFEKRICIDLNIKHLTVEGRGTTGHAWSLIYLPEEDRWVHFDMTMVKFYQDEWIREHRPYTEEDWIAATTENIFKMQKSRQIHSINGKKCYFDKDNYRELDINAFDCTILPDITR